MGTQTISKVPATAKGIMQMISETPISKIAELDFVKNKYIQNYNACNPNGDGEFMYHRNLVFMKQAISSFKSAVDPFSVYACITTIAMYGASAAPMDEEVYFIPRAGKMCLQFQPGMKVKKLERSKQIVSVKKVNLVFEGDTIEIEDGFVVKHKEKLQSDKIIAGYIKFNMPDGGEKHFIYRPFHWDSWKNRSPDKTGANWNYTSTLSDGTKITQPLPGFLISKIISHACSEKSWTPGRTPATVEVYSEVVIGEDENIGKPEYAKKAIGEDDIPEITEHEEMSDEETAETTPEGSPIPEVVGGRYTAPEPAPTTAKPSFLKPKATDGDKPF